MLGREEIDEIAPASADCTHNKVIDVYGPIPADSVFFQAIRGDFDAVVTLYHDQGHIAVKTHGFEQSITITLGLPIIRTSADHGTAFDIAGQGIANEASMVRLFGSSTHCKAAKDNVKESLIAVIKKCLTNSLLYCDSI